MSSATPELVELSSAERESIERSAITIVENIPRDQRGKILDAMERTYLKLARKYGKADGKGRPGGGTRSTGIITSYTKGSETLPSWLERREDGVRNHVGDVAPEKWWSLTPGRWG